MAARVTIGVLSMVVAGTATLLFLESARLHEAYLSERRAHLGEDLETGALRLNQAVNTLRQDVLFLSNIPPVSGIVRAALNRGYDSRYGNTHKVWAERLQQIFSAFSIAHPVYYRIRYIGMADGGREIVRIDNRGGRIETTPPDGLQARADRDYFKATLGLHDGQVFLSEFSLEQKQGVVGQPPHPTLRAATPVFTPSGEMFGMVVVDMDVGGLLKSAISDLPGVQTYITNRDGQYLFHPDSGPAFQFEQGGKNNIATDFPFIRAMLDPMTADYLPLQAAAQKAGSPLFSARRILVDSGDPQRFLLLMYYLPGAVVAEQVDTIPVNTILLQFMAMLLVGGIAVLALRRTFSPLKQITAAANKIAAGDQDTLSLPTSGGEVGSLANALNAMLSKLSQRERLLQESEAKYRRLHESMIDAYVMTDMSGRLLEFNHTYREMLGYSADELHRLTYVDLTPEKWHEFEAWIIDEQVIPHGYSQVYEKEHIRKDGTVFPVELKTFLLRDKNDQPEAMWAIVRDITERKQVEAERAQAEALIQQFGSLLQGSFSEIYMFDADSLHFTLTSEGAEKNLGYSDDEMNRLTPLDIEPLFTLESYEQLIAPLRDGERSLLHFETAHRRKDGTTYPVEVRLQLMPTTTTTTTTTTTFLAIIQDITERKQAETKLRKFSEKIEDLYNNAPCGYHSLDKDGAILMMNDTELLWLGYTQDEVIGKIKWADLLSPSGIQIFRETFPQLMELGSIGDIEVELIRKDGTVFTALINATAIYGPDGNFVMSRSTVTDITGRKRIERRLHDLAAHLQSVREEEKAGIAREIHDDMGGTLTALKIETYWLTTELSAYGDTASLLNHIGEMSKLIDNAMGVMRNVITGLRPTILDDLGLLAALEWQAAQFHKHTGIGCRVNCVCATDEGCATELDKARQIALFRIVQEALNNVAKHSGASRVEIEFHQSDEEVVMSIIDNGRGMAKKRSETGKPDVSIPYGILGMCERADQLGGKISFDTPPGGGLCVTVILPLLEDDGETA